MHVCTYNVLGTQMAPIRWNGPSTPYPVTKHSSPTWKSRYCGQPYQMQSLSLKAPKPQHSLMFLIKYHLRLLVFKLDTFSTSLLCIDCMNSHPSFCVSSCVSVVFLVFALSVFFDPGLFPFFKIVYCLP